MSTLEKMAQSLIDGNVNGVVELTNAAVSEGTDAGEIMDKGLLAGMDVVGQRFKAGEMFIPEVLRCAKAMHGAMEILRPMLADADAKSAGTLVIGTVEGEDHEPGIVGTTHQAQPQQLALAHLVEQQLLLRQVELHIEAAVATFGTKLGLARMDGQPFESIDKFVVGVKP